MDVLRKILKYFNIFLVTILVIVCSIFIFKGLIKKENPIYIFNHSYLEVLSGSMNPTIKKGNVIIIKKSNNYEIGDIVTYRYKSSFITHEIIKKNNDEIITKGTANKTEDNAINKSDIVGKVVMVIPFSVKVLFIFIAFIIVVLLVLEGILLGKKVKKSVTTIIVMVGISLSFTITTYAIFRSVYNANTSFIAAHVITETNIRDNITVYLNDIIPGETKNYQFSVTNFKQENNETYRSEVNLNYTITIEKSTNIPLRFELFKNNINENIIDINNTTNNQFLNYQDDIIDNYSLNIIWPSENAEYEYANKVDYIDIVIESKQVL